MKSKNLAFHVQTFQKYQDSLLLHQLITSQQHVLEIDLILTELELAWTSYWNVKLLSYRSISLIFFFFFYDEG